MVELLVKQTELNAPSPRAKQAALGLRSTASEIPRPRRLSVNPGAADALLADDTTHDAGAAESANHPACCCRLSALGCRFGWPVAFHVAFCVLLLVLLAGRWA